MLVFYYVAESVVYKDANTIGERAKSITLAGWSVTATLMGPT